MQKLREGTSKSDVEIAEQKFDKYDLDKSGTMDAKDLSLLMEDLKLRLKAPEIAQLEKEIAGDDGVITKDAFIDWYVKDKDERDQLGDDDDEGGDGGDEDDEKADE
jgi:Ca2+-binding EF-hand superfamily protein